MNIILIRKISLLAIALGLIVGFVALLPDMIGYSLFFLMFFSSLSVILYLKKDENFKIITTKDSTIYGSLIGFISTIGFFLSFSPMVCILKAILKENYYSYGIPDMLSMGFWLFFIIVFVTGFVFALTNSISAMGIGWIFERLEDKIENNKEEQ